MQPDTPDLDMQPKVPATCVLYFGHYSVSMLIVAREMTIILFVKWNTHF